MAKINSILVLAFLFTASSAEFTGPFLIWGGKNLNSLKVPALEGKIKISEFKIS